jgi:hypothetical protein
MRKDGKLEIGGKTYDVVTVDFETYYANDYTLSGKMNMSEYVRDARFHVHGVGIKRGNKPTLWYTKDQIKLALKEIDWSKSALLAHNTPFDGFIMSEHFDCVPAFYLDTLAMARGVHGHHTRHDLDTIAKLHGRQGKTKRAALADTKNKLVLTDAEERALGGYCVDDCNDTYEIFWDMYDHLPDEELRLVELTTRMFCDPVLKVDIPRVQAELERETGGKVAALLLSGANAEDLLSNERFANMLRGLGVSPPSKLSLTTGKMTYAFAKSDAGFKALLHHTNPKVRALAEARLKIKSTIGETRAVRFLEAGKDGKCLPIALNYSGAHTHRWSGGNKMNAQNLKRGGELRRSILAPDGHVIVVADSAQIEARVLAWLANQLDIVHAFAAKDDVYKLMASAIYGVPVDQVTKDQRFIGKICVLGLGYGMGPDKLRDTLAAGTMGPPVHLEAHECQRIVDIYRSRNSEIVKLWRKMDMVITSMVAGAVGKLGPIEYGKSYIRLPNGMFLHYYGITGDIEERRGTAVVTNAKYMTRNAMSKIYGGLLTENVVQALSRCIIAEQMLKVADKYRVVTMTHDEIVAVCPAKDADKCLEYMLEVMSTPPEWAPDLPLAAEGGYDTCYSK